MPVEARIVEHGEVAPADVAWLAKLVANWHLLADLSFSDLVLWVPDADDNIFWAVAQLRPATGPTALEADVVGEQIAYDYEHLVTEAYLSGQVCSTSDNKLSAGIPVDVHAVPITRGGRCVAIVERHTNQMVVRAPGALEDAYLSIAAKLEEGLTRGWFPFAPQDAEPATVPRVGDGVISLDAAGCVRYASPNAITAYRHLGFAGDLEMEDLLATTRSLAPDTRGGAIEEPLFRPLERPAVLDIENARAAVRCLVLPVLDRRGRRETTLVLLRDITELRHRERQLVTKDATIREIHHRVKNNLQTVAALLRLQARRIESPEARAALSDAMDRVSAIAVVHEILSQGHAESVAFDEVCDRILAMVGAVAAPAGTVRARRDGTFGAVRGDAANHLALVVTELCQNAIEHGLAAGEGTVTVRPRRDEAALTVEVVDDGIGLPAGFTLAGSRSLGLSIVSTLVSDLGGSFELAAREEGGSVAAVRLPLGALDG